MNLKKRLEKRIHGWLPKVTLPHDQRIRMGNRFMQLQLLRVAYGVMLGALLFIPFGVYHSRVEPYITGYLWGYNLPVGYVGLLLGVVAILYPRLDALRRLKFSAFLLFIGLSLFLTFLFSPGDYFINLFNGTNFSSAQIDVDFAVGNSAVLYLALLSMVVGSLSFIRGWLPKEPDLNNIKRTMEQRNWTRKPVVGVVLISLGVTALIFSVLIATRTDTVIDTSFVLNSNEKFGSYENGTYYHTHAISKSALTGEVIAQGGGVSFTANGYNTQRLKNSGVTQNFSWVIEPADDQYTFTFENTGDDPSSVRFTVKETWTPFLLLAPAFIILLITSPTGTILIIRGGRKQEDYARNKSFFRRPEGMGFWTMMLLSVPFAWLTSAGTETRDWLFAVVFFIAGWIVFLVSWLVLAWRRPLSAPMEKVERACFWVMVPASIMILLAGYLLASVFSYALLYVLATGTSIYCVDYILDLFANYGCTNTTKTSIHTTKHRRSNQHNQPANQNKPKTKNTTTHATPKKWC